MSSPTFGTTPSFNNYAEPSAPEPPVIISDESEKQGSPFESHSMNEIRTSFSDPAVSQNIFTFGKTHAEQTFLERNHVVLTHLQDCILSAGKMVSSASTILSASNTDVGSTCGSDFEDLLTEDRQRLVESWIPEIGRGYQSDKLAKLAHDNDYTLVGAPKYHSDDSDSDIEVEVVKNIRRAGKKYFEDAEYADADEYLQRTIALIEKKKGVHFEGRDELYDMLVTSYCRQCKWDLAEDALHRILGREPEQEIHMLRPPTC